MTHSSQKFSAAIVAIAFVIGGTTVWTVRRLMNRPPRPTPATTAVHSQRVEGDKCPVLSSWVASPLQTSSPRGIISVAAAAMDADGDRLNFAWTATAGTFADPLALQTLYTCTTAGEQTLTLTVSDDHNPGPCSTWLTIPVTCVP
jgi:hypothetical protein